MKNIIHFDYGNGFVTVKAYGRVKLPKIGENVNMSFIIQNENEKQDFFERFGSYSLTVVDINRQLDAKSKEHHVAINLSADMTKHDLHYQVLAN